MGNFNGYHFHSYIQTNIHTNALTDKCGMNQDLGNLTIMISVAFMLYIISPLPLI